MFGSLFILRFKIFLFRYFLAKIFNWGKGHVKIIDFDLITSLVVNVISQKKLL